MAKLTLLNDMGEKSCCPERGAIRLSMHAGGFPDRVSRQEGGGWPTLSRLCEQWSKAVLRYPGRDICP